MSKNAFEILKKYYGYNSFRDGQEDIINSILSGKDTFAVMPTGAGKSICYQIPALLFSGITIVISPLISLMKDQVDGLINLGIKAAYINSSLGYDEIDDIFYKAKNGEIKLLYVAPERLESTDFKELLKTIDISMVAIDEAHCVSQWGHDFRPSYRYIAPTINELPKRPVISAFTATATENVKEDVVSLLGLNKANVYVMGFDRKNLSFTVIRGENKKDFILDYVKRNSNKSGIIYAATRKEVDSLYEMLNKRGYLVGKYHAGLSDKERAKNQDAFLYDDINIIIATNAFGMGIDKSNVRYVIHYSIPKDIESYYQEAGRAGRDGEDSECIMLFSAQDVSVQKFLIEKNVSSPERKLNEYKKLQDMVDYCHTSKCLRKYILEYFGEKDVPDKCGNCSNCNDDTELSDITIEAQKIFSCIYRMRERYGATLVAQVLKGSRNKKIRELGFENLSTYGIMKEYTEKEIRDIINVLTAENYLKATEGEYPVLRLKEKAVPVLKGKEKVFQRVQKKKENVVLDNSLFEVLRRLRKEISEREQVPPYVVFPDSTLKDMSEKYPLNEEEMLNIKGVGEFKLKKYGELFLNEIEKYVNENNIKIEKEHSDNNKNQSKDKEEDVPSHVISLNMYKEGKSIEEISKIRELKVQTVQDHIIKCFEEGLNVDLESLIPEGQEQLVLNIVKKIGAKKLKPIKEALGDKVSYTTIKAVICKNSMK